MGLRYRHKQTTVDSRGSEPSSRQSLAPELCMKFGLQKLDYADNCARSALVFGLGYSCVFLRFTVVMVGGVKYF